MDSRELVLNRLVEMESIIGQMRKDLEEVKSISFDYGFKRAWGKIIDLEIVVKGTKQLLEQNIKPARWNS